MSDTNKPREWWIEFVGEDDYAVYDRKPKPSPIDTKVHVIEMSAYLAVRKERDELLIELMPVHNSLATIITNDLLNHITQERDQLLTDRKRLLDEVEVLRGELYTLKGTT